MKIYDISMPISETIMTYKNKAEGKPIFKTVGDHETGSSHSTDITLNLHTGSHIDAPLHMIKEGETMEVYALERFISKAKVIDLTHVEDKVTKADLIDKNIEAGDFVLLKTRNSSEDFFNMEWIALGIDGAQYLADLDVNGVGIDALGIERGQPSHRTHTSLMDKHIIIMEGLRLAEVPQGTYELIALPLNLVNVEASMTRPILIER